MRIGIASDHGGFELKMQLLRSLRDGGHDLCDYGANVLDPEDDYPDYVVPLAKAVAGREVERGIAVCGSGVGACIAANKVAGARACLVAESFSAHQGVEDDDMNILCLGGRVTGHAMALEIVRTFLGARFLGLERFRRRLRKIESLEQEKKEFFDAGD